MSSFFSKKTRQYGKQSANRTGTFIRRAESCRILARRMNGKSKWIFPSCRDSERPTARLNSAHDRVCLKAKKDEGISLDFVLYDFRHTFATRMAEAGIDFVTLAA